MTTESERFWAKVDKHGPMVVESLGRCWSWTASENGAGYGKIRLSSKSNKLVLAHRFSKSLDDNSDPERPELCLHLCDNRNCVNPDHLYWGTYSDNNYDSVNRSGRKTGYIASERCSRGHSKELGKQCETCRYMHDIAKTWRRILSRGEVYKPTIKTRKRLKSMGLTLDYIDRELKVTDY